MAGNTEAILVAGTIVSFDSDGGGSMTAIPGITSFGAIGDTTESKERTALADNRRVYGVALSDSPDQTITGQYLSGDADQAAFLAKAKAKEAVDIEIEWPDGTKAAFNMQFLGFTLDEGTAEDWQLFSITAKRNTDVAWTMPA